MNEGTKPIPIREYKPADESNDLRREYFQRIDAIKPQWCLISLLKVLLDTESAYTHPNRAFTPNFSKPIEVACSETMHWNWIKIFCEYQEFLPSDYLVRYHLEEAFGDASNEWINWLYFNWLHKWCHSLVYMSLSDHDFNLEYKFCQTL